MTAPRTSASPARALAARAVTAVLSADGRLSDALTQQGADGSRMDARDAGLARQLAFGAVRHLGTIESVLSRFAAYEPRRTHPALRAVLLTAGYQLLYLDRVPPFAAVNEAVSLAGRLRGGAAAKMVNAVLRRAAEAVAQHGAKWDAAHPAAIRTGWNSATILREPLIPGDLGDEANRGEAAHDDGNPGSGPPERNRRGGGAHHEDNRRRRLALQTGETPARLAQWIERFGEERGIAAAWAGQALPPAVLHRNSRRLSREEFASRAAAEFGGASPADAAAVWGSDADGEAVLFVPPGVRVAESAILREGLAYVQDLTAADAARLLNVHRVEQVLDLCAAPGGKSIALALRGARVLACDASAARLERLRENAQRLGLEIPCCITTEGRERACIERAVAREADASTARAPSDPSPSTADAPAVGAPSDPHTSTADAPAVGAPSNPSASTAAREPAFDAAMVDVPCSNSGVLARRPEARLRLSATALRTLSQLQLRLLRVAAGCIRRGGRMVYSTCSIEPEENERVVEAFVRSDPRWRCAAQRLTLPTWGACPSAWRDGGFAALLVDAGSP
ncbi:MAG: hypothetical protein IPM64_16085 [Phycisphaerales bacterium]|nr:hypothetical protein [Phycisphaerales bacterium]